MLTLKSEGNDRSGDVRWSFEAKIKLLITTSGSQIYGFPAEHQLHVYWIEMKLAEVKVELADIVGFCTTEGEVLV
jgi:hypothetical protein